MKKRTNSIIAGCFMVAWLLVGVMIGYVLTPPKTVVQTVYLHEPLYEPHIINETVVIYNSTTEYIQIPFSFSTEVSNFTVLVFSVSVSNLTILEITVGNSEGETISPYHTFLYQTYQWSNFTIFTLELQPGDHTFQHIFYNTYLVEYFLY